MLHDTTEIIEHARRDQYELTLADVASLAAKSERTVRRWAATGLHGRGVLPAVETVNGLRFRASDVREYLRARPVEPQEAAATSKTSSAVARVVAAAPRLTDEQREQLAAILGGAR